MSAVPIRAISVKLDRNVAPVVGEAFASAPLTVVGTLPTGLTFEGVTAVYAELHNSGGLIATDDGLEVLPTGDSVSLTFSGTKMQQAAGRYFISVYAVYPGDRIEILRTANLHLYDGLASFRQLVYWGTSAEETLDAADVAALGNSSLNSNREQSFTVDGGGEYIYFVCPASFGVPSFAANGFPTVGWTEGNVELTSDTGAPVAYKTYRTPTTQAGDGIEITVS
jgi:hypothetical protein